MQSTEGQNKTKQQSPSAKNEIKSQEQKQPQQNKKTQSPIKIKNEQEKMFDAEQIINSIKIKPLLLAPKFPAKNGIEVAVEEVTSNGSGPKRYSEYVLRGRDRNGTFSIAKRYKTMVLFREKLVIKWPGFLIPPIPRTSKIGKSQEDVVQERTLFLNNFFAKIQEHIYYNKQTQQFLKNGDTEFLAKLKDPKWSQVLRQYREECPTMFELKDEQSVSIEGELQSFEKYFKEWKNELSGFVQSFTRVSELKSKYASMMQKVSSVMLPEYQQVLLRWIENVEVEKEEELPLMVSENRKSNQAPISPIIMPGFYTQNRTHFCLPNWGDSTKELRNAFRLEFREVQALLQCIEQIKYISKEQDYYARTIRINLEEIQFINAKKTTLKSFVMGGTEDQKRTKLTQQSKLFQENLKNTVQVKQAILKSIFKSMKEFHQQKIKEYIRSITKGLHGQMQIVKRVIEFHYQQIQLNDKQSLIQKEDE